MRVLVLVLAFLAAAAAGHAAPAGVFAGRTVYVVTGFGPGGANDMWARTVAKHIGNHLPGRPRIVAQNSPGAGSLKLMNELSNVLPKDGTVIGLVSRGIPLEPLLGGEGIQFDPLKMNWVGSPDRDTTVCVARKDAAVKSMDELLTKELLVGATGSGADTAIYPEFLAALLGMKFKTVKGYQGSKEIFLAIERKEVDGVCIAYDSFSLEPLAREGRANILFQAALEPDPRLNDVPVGIDLARTAGDREALRLFLLRASLGRPFVLPPDVAPERVAIWRKAFADTMQDREFLADARRQELNVSVQTGEALANLLASVYKTPQETVARTVRALGRAPNAR